MLISQGPERRLQHSLFVPETPLGAGASIRFTDIERTFDKLPVDTAGDLIVDAKTEAALAQATAQLPYAAQFADTALARYRFLIGKTLPSPASDTYAELLDRYIQYRRAEQAAAVLTPAVTLEAQFAHFEAARRLRNRFFSAEISAALFGVQDALAEYTFALRRVEADASLNDAQRDIAKAQLQASYDARQQLHR